LNVLSRPLGQRRSGFRGPAEGLDRALKVTTKEQQMTYRQTPDMSKTHDQVIGTSSGRVWHQNRNEPNCESCRIAYNAWRTGYRERGMCATGLGWPLSLRHRKLPAKFRKDPEQLKIVAGYINSDMITSEPLNLSPLSTVTIDQAPNNDIMIHSLRPPSTSQPGCYRSGIGITIHGPGCKCD
jgi:hypothetical protein